MASKADLGTRKKCFTCKEMMEGREIEYDGNVKYQWQDGNENKAHYSYNQETQKTHCKKMPKKEDDLEMDASTMPPSAMRIPSMRMTRITAKELQTKYDQISSDLEYPEIMQMRISAIRDCEIMGITEGIEIGAHINNVVRRLN